jgi:hypothetical protein
VRDAGEQEGAASPRRKLALPRALVRMQAGAEGCGNWYGAACLGDESGVRCGEGGLVSSCAENPRWQPGDYLMASAAVGERMARAVVSSRAFISLIHETIKCSTSFLRTKHLKNLTSPKPHACVLRVHLHGPDHRLDAPCARDPGPVLRA